MEGNSEEAQAHKVKYHTFSLTQILLSNPYTCIYIRIRHRDDRQPEGHEEKT